MHVITEQRLAEFWKDRRYRDSESLLRAWLTVVRRSRFKNTHELRESFPSVDFVGKNRAIFDIGNNKYRLIVDVRYDLGRIYVRGVFTHAQYDKLDITAI